MGFLKKTLKFFKIATCGNFFVECVSKGIISYKYLCILFVRFFGQKSENFCWKKLENIMGKQSILKKTLSSFKKASLPKWEKGKYVGGSRPSCY